MHLQQHIEDEKLQALCDAEGFDRFDAMLEAATFDSLSPGIRTKPDRNGTV